MNTENMKGLASLGRNEDNYLAHVAAGEMVVPPVITPETRQRLEQEMMSVGLNPNEYKVGNGMSINPITGNPEFGFFKKLGKSLKKVVKKVAPIAAIGLGVAGFAGAGPLGGFLGKGAAKATTGKIFGAGGKFRTGLSSFFNPAKGTPGIFGGKFGPNLRRGIGGLFGGGEEMPTVDALAADPQYKTRIARLRSEGLSDAQILQELGMAQTSGGFMDGKSPLEFFSSKFLPQGVEDALGTGPGGSFLGEGKGGGLGNLGIAGLAGLVGKLAYEDAKNFKGVPLTPLTTMDQLGRYNIAAEIARQKGEEMPSRVEYGLTGEGMPVLQGGKPRNAAMGGIMAFADGGVVEMAEGGEPPIDPANFPPMDGDINGPGTETSDDIPAMLSDGEFVMTAKAVRGAGGFDMAKGNNGIVTLTPNGDPGRDSGTRVMYKLMEHFGSVA